MSTHLVVVDVPCLEEVHCPAGLGVEDDEELLLDRHPLCALLELRQLAQLLLALLLFEINEAHGGRSVSAVRLGKDCSGERVWRLGERVRRSGGRSGEGEGDA